MSRNRRRFTLVTPSLREVPRAQPTMETRSTKRIIPMCLSSICRGSTRTDRDLDNRVNAFTNGTILKARVARRRRYSNGINFYEIAPYIYPQPGCRPSLSREGGADRIGRQLQHRFTTPYLDKLRAFYSAVLSRPKLRRRGCHRFPWKSPVRVTPVLRQIVAPVLSREVVQLKRKNKLADCRIPESEAVSPIDRQAEDVIF